MDLYRLLSEETDLVDQIGRSGSVLKNRGSGTFSCKQINVARSLAMR